MNLRPYVARIWDPLTEEEKQQAKTPKELRLMEHYRCYHEHISDEVMAIDLNDAERQLIEKHGQGKLFSIWNEEDSNKPR